MTLEEIRAHYLPRVMAEEQVIVAQLFRDTSVTRIQTDPDPENHRAIRCYEKAGFRAVRTITTPDGPALYLIQDRPKT